MNYSDVIYDNCKNHSAVSWWPKFAYHYTDVTNAVSILDTGLLYSRASVEQLGLMQNDNASRQVIDMTQTSAISCVRFYFRPLTPTQYYNEGFKHSQLRYYNDENANTPVPVFFVFDLAKLLTIPGVRFSELPQSGYGSELKSGIEDFSKLNFDAIYSKGYENITETKRFRHAEILHPSSFQIDDCLENILCRNSIERVTLLNLLKKKNYLKFSKYKDKIKVCKSDMFENNGLFITECNYHNNKISISFSDTLAKQKYAIKMMSNNNVDALKPITVRFVLDWLNSQRVVHHSGISVNLNYQNSTGISLKGLPSYPTAKSIQIQVFVEDKLMCFVEQSLEVSELIK